MFVGTMLPDLDAGFCLRDQNRPQALGEIVRGSNDVLEMDREPGRLHVNQAGIEPGCLLLDRHEVAHLTRHVQGRIARRNESTAPFLRWGPCRLAAMRATDTVRLGFA